MTQVRTSVGLYGIGATSLGRFADDFRSWFKRRNADGRRRIKLTLPTIAYVPLFKNNLKAAEIYLIETVSVFMTVRNQIAPGATVVIADSPLLLNEVPQLIQLDSMFDVRRFRIHQIDYSVFDAGRLAAAETAEPHPWLHTLPVSLDRLGLVIDETASGTLLTPFNGLSNQLNFHDRIHFRKFLARYLEGSITLSAFEASMKKLLKDAVGDTQIASLNLDKVCAMLKKHGTVYQQAIVCSIDKRSPNRLIKDTAITPFEIRWCTRLVVQHRSKDILLEKSA